MHFLQLVKHFYLSERRSAMFERNLATTIFVGFMAIYFGGIMLLIGLLADKILLKLAPDTYELYTANLYLLPYFLLSLVARYFMQSVPFVKLQPYLTLRLSKGTLLHFVMFMMLGSAINLAPIFLMLLPFCLKLWFQGATGFPILAWATTYICLDVITTLAIVHLKRYFNNNLNLFLVILFFVGVLTALNFYGYFNITTISATLFDPLIPYPFVALGWIILTATLYYFTHKTLAQQLYTDAFPVAKNKTTQTAKSLTWLENWGEIGQYILLETKLIWRNKRTRTVFMMSMFFIFYGLIFILNKQFKDNSFMLLFASTFTTGGFLINYGQFLFSWESSYWDGLLVRRMPMSTYLNAKFYLFAAVALFSFIVSIPLVYFGMNILITNAIMLLYNIGVNAFIVFFASTYNKKRIDLAAASAMNWQGVGASQWLLSLPIFILPLLITGPFSYFIDDNAGLIALAVCGVLGIVLHPVWLKLVAQRLKTAKYETAEGFRQQS